MTRKLISFDWASKEILRNKENFGILEGFLSELLSNDIQILEVFELKNESNQDSINNTFSRIDIKTKDSDGKIIIIEVQYSNGWDYLYRLLYANSKTVTEHLDKKEAYFQASKIISVSILFFVYGEGNDYIYHGTTRFVGIHDHNELKLSEKEKNIYTMDKIKDIYPEHYLIQVNNFDNAVKHTLDEWIYFFKNDEIKDGFTAKGLKQAKETLNILKMNDEEYWTYEQYEKQLHREASLYESSYILGKIKGRKESFKEGKKIGFKESMLQVAINMKNADIAVDVIASVTQLSIAEINAL